MKKHPYSLGNLSSNRWILLFKVSDFDYLFNICFKNFFDSIFKKSPSYYLLTASLFFIWKPNILSRFIHMWSIFDKCISSKLPLEQRWIKFSKYRLRWCNFYSIPFKTSQEKHSFLKILCGSDHIWSLFTFFIWQKSGHSVHAEKKAWDFVRSCYLHHSSEAGQ